MKLLAVIACIILAGCLAEPDNGKLTNLRTNFETTPLAIEDQTPRFSWQLQTAGGRGQQMAYQLTVFNDDGKPVWDSGRVNSAQATNVAYSGPELIPEQHYEWQVNAWLKDGSRAQGESWFETGLMNPNQSAWAGAQWIGGSASDKVFAADYLSVFKVKVSLQLGKNSQRAAFLLGGNDYRLQNPNLNIRHVENGKDQSFVAFELDISGLQQANGQAQLHIYRAGYAPEDNPATPLFSLPIANNLINTNNQHSTHDIYIDCEFGVCSVYVDGRDQNNNITPVDPSLLSHETPGLNLNPVGRGNNYLSYPMLADIGFWVKPGQQALFSNIEIRHRRPPANIIFAAGANTSTNYQEIFIGRNSQITLSEAGYQITAEEKPVVILADPSRDGTPMLRHEFSLADKPIATARLHATARGVYEMFINGQRVGTDYFAPGLTQYNKHHTYQTYDVTELLNAGTNNAIGALLGEGWWSGNITYDGANWNYFGDQQSLLSKLVITFNDGSEQIITSQPNSWQVFHGGPIRYGSFFQGEIYDARKESAIAGWSRPGYNSEQWQAASVVPIQGTSFLGDTAQNQNNQLVTSYDAMQLVAHPGNSPKIVKTLQAQSVEEVHPGVYVYDMGQNMVGFPRIELGQAVSDQPVLLRYAEVRYPQLPEHKGLEGMIMMENFRAALVNDTYYPKGNKDVIQPRFTFHGYRYIEITGITRALPVESVKGLVVSSVAQLSANYETSNPLVNQLWQNITWSMRGNFLSIPTDTPARNERMGWNGDLNVFASTALYMADINGFIERHLWALRDIQAKPGRFADVVPVGGGFGGTLWGSAGIIVPWQNYQQYQDISLLRDHYPAMVKYVDFLQTKIDSQTGVLIEGPWGIG